MDRNLLLKKVCFAGILTCFAIIAFTLESLFPPLFIPGARMGVSNIFILFSVIVLGWQYGYAVLVVKILLGSLFSGNFSSILYSLPAGLIALTCEILLLKLTDKFSVVCISVFGAVINNLIQNTVFCLITNTLEFFIYLPYLALIGIMSGLIIGFTVYLLINKLPSSITQLKSKSFKEDKQ